MGESGDGRVESKVLKNTRDSSLFQCAFRDRPVVQTVQLKKSWGQEYHTRPSPLRSMSVWALNLVLLVICIKRW